MILVQFAMGEQVCGCVKNLASLEHRGFIDKHTVYPQFGERLR